MTWTSEELPPWGRAGRAQPVAQTRGRKSLFYEPIRSRIPAGARLEILEDLAECHDPFRRVDHSVLIIRTSRGPERLDSAHLVEFCTYDLEPLRRPVSFTRDRKRASLYSFASPWGAYSVWTESAQEAAHLTDLVWRANPVFIATQALSLNFQIGNLWIEHIPDLVAELPGGQRVVVDVHGIVNGQDDLDFVIKARLTRRLLRTLGIEYHLVGAVSPQRSMNLVHLRRYIRTSDRVRRLAMRLTDVPPTITSFNGWVEQQSRKGVPRALAVAAVMRALWKRLLWVDLDRPIRGHTLVRREPNEMDLHVPGLRVEGENGWVAGPHASASSS